MDIKEIQQYLQHRYPFLLIDRVEELVQGEHIVALKNVTINEPQFTGHFENNPIFPGVYLIEAMAQASGVLALKTSGEKVKATKAYVLAGIDKTRFKRSVVPGDQLKIHSKVITCKRGIWKFRGEVKIDGETAASAELLCAEREL
ncbi:MAG: 3-hydroxyacyl-[acyl-carrier-protein] dehydratase FabZ [Gammaproteobacteria bacterium]|nr:MAG: 3-hydroxyacyl-[acyl-carrier-protein] dehydratase FabZ [Gammaproteobacteria bacterium]